MADKVIAISSSGVGSGICGFAPIGGFWSVNMLGCTGTPAHEIGHQLDLYHINCGSPASACMGVNAADCNDPDFRTDIMSYCGETHYGPQAYKYLKIKYFNRILGP
mgnify:FL=1